MKSENRPILYGAMRWILSLGYIGLVALCIFLAFDFAGSTHAGFWCLLFLITLPWSLISIIFLWAIMQGAGLELFSAMYSGFGLINAYLIYRVLGPEVEE